MSLSIDSKNLGDGINQITLKWKSGKSRLFSNGKLSGTSGIKRDRCLAYVEDPLSGERADVESLNGSLFGWSALKEAASGIVKKKPTVGLLSLGAHVLDPTQFLVTDGQLMAGTGTKYGQTYFVLGDDKGPMAKKESLTTTNGQADGLTKGSWLSGIPLVWDGEANTDQGFLDLAKTGNLYDLSDWVCLPYLGPYGYLGVDQIATKGKFPYEFAADFEKAVAGDSKYELALKIDSESIRKGEDRFSWLNRAVRRSFTKQKHLGEVTEAGDVFLRRLESMSLNFQPELRARLALGIHEDGSWLVMYTNGRSTDKEATGISMADMAKNLKAAGAQFAIQIDSGPDIGFIGNEIEFAAPRSGKTANGILFY